MTGEELGRLEALEAKVDALMAVMLPKWGLADPRCTPTGLDLDPEARTGGRTLGLLDRVEELEKRLR